METGRFEALIDAILAIIITLIVMEIPLPETPTWTALIQLYPDFIAYTLSFIICYNIWNYHHNIFGLVNKIDSTITWTSAVSIMIVGLLPHVTTMISSNFHSFTAQAMFGLIFFMTNIILYITDTLLINKDKANIALVMVLKQSQKSKITMAIIYTIGFIIGYLYYPPAIIISCIITVLMTFIPRKIRRKIRKTTKIPV